MGIKEKNPVIQNLISTLFINGKYDISQKPISVRYSDINGTTIGRQYEAMVVPVKLTKV